MYWTFGQDLANVTLVLVTCATLSESPFWRLTDVVIWTGTQQYQYQYFVVESWK